jgi:predicted nucleic acid-binding protein
VFDSGVIITLSLNNLLGKLNLLKKNYGEFYITEEVKKELVDRPIKGRKFKLEALQIQRLIDSKILKVYSKKLNVGPVLKLCNSIFRCGKNLKVLDKAEVESFLLASELKCAYVVDERTMRMLIEHPFGLEKVLERKMRCNVEIDSKKLNEFKEICPVKVLRSVELMVVAYSKGYFRDLKGDVLDALLWGLKLRGSSISFDEIKKIKDNV